MTRDEYIRMQCEISMTNKPPVPAWIQRRLDAACAVWNDPQNEGKQKEFEDAWSNPIMA